MLVPSRSERLIPRMLGPRPVCLKWVMIRHRVMSVVPLKPDIQHAFHVRFVPQADIHNEMWVRQ